MKTVFSITATVLFLSAAAQKKSFDILRFTPPAGWKTEVKEQVIIYSTQNPQNKTWCQIALYGSVISKGTAEEDFNTLWQELAVKNQKATGLQKMDPVQNGDWQVVAGSGQFSFRNQEAATLLTTYTGNNLCVAIQTNTNHAGYISTVQELLTSLELTPGNGALHNEPANNNTKMQSPARGFRFNSTHFDDGWTSTEQANWVEVKKPGTRILIHYPNQQADQHHFNKLEGDHNAWNVLVAPRYNAVSNFLERGIQDYQSVTFLTADATDRETGKRVHVVLFKKHYDKGHGRYLEVVADSKAVFEKEFGNHYINRSSWDYLEQTNSWNKLADMQWRNKFAVAPDDLTGTWSSSTYASLSYYYVNGGGFAGATATSIADEYSFRNGNRYESDHAGASGVAGNQKFSRQVYKGSYSIAGWSITLSNRFQGQSEKFDACFEAIRGGRILLMTDRLGTTVSLVKSK